MICWHASAYPVIEVCSKILSNPLEFLVIRPCIARKIKQLLNNVHHY